MNTCDTCKHWTAGEYSNVRLCKCPAIKFGSVQFSEDDNSEVMASKDDDSRVDLDEAAVIDGSGYLAELYTGPKFGCVRWEA